MKKKELSETEGFESEFFDAFVNRYYYFCMKDIHSWKMTRKFIMIGRIVILLSLGYNKVPDRVGSARDILWMSSSNLIVIPYSLLLRNEYLINIIS